MLKLIENSQNFSGLLKGTFFSALILLPVMTAACSKQTSNLNSRKDTGSQSVGTLISVEEREIIVRLTPNDSERLSAALSKVSIQPISQPTDSAAKPMLTQLGKDLSVECVSSTDAPVFNNCTVSINLKPVASENFVSSDTSTNEHMFQLRRAEDAKRLYSSLNVKEWDLQGSTYKRFSSSDNKMILECILDEERSRCSVFLSNGESDDFSD